MKCRNYQIENNSYSNHKDKLQIEIIETDKEIQSEKNKLLISPLGSQVCEFCYEYFNHLFEFDFTNKMESQLDFIENGNTCKKQVLDEYVKIVETSLMNMNTNVDSKYTNQNKQSLHCGKWNKKNVIIKNGPFGYYASIGTKEKISMKQFTAFDIKEKIDTQYILTEDEKMHVIDYLNQSKQDKETQKNNNPNILMVFLQ